MSELSLFIKAMLQERKDILLSILGGFFAGIAGVVLFSISGYLISKTVFAPPLYTLIILTSLIKILGVARAASRYGERLYSHRATFSLLSRLRTAFFAKLVPLMPGILHRQRSGDLLARIVGDIESLQFYFLRVAYPPVIVISVFATTVLFTSFFSFWIALLFVVGMLITAFVVPGIVTIGQRKTYGQVRQQRAALSADAADLMQGFIDLKVYGQLDARKKRLLDASDHLTTVQQKDALGLLRGQSMHAFVTFLISWAVLVLGACLIYQGSLSGIFLAMLIMTAMTVFDESAAMATLPAYKRDSELAAKRLAATFDGSGLEAHVSVSEGKKIHHKAVSVELNEVSFQYEQDWRPVLNAVSFTLEAGSKTAIVGPSGSGKTSILELLLKLNTPTSGKIRIGDNALEEYDTENLWAHANVVLQENHFFSGTIRDNLLLADTTATDHQLLAILEQVDLQNKYLDDPVLEKGENLSDGEKQRLAIARALLRQGRLWLLDEPTSALDYVTEHHVLKLLLKRAQEDTLIMICHRLTGLENMDRIIVMDHGSVIESGTYHELMEQRGYFYELKQIESQMIGQPAAMHDMQRFG